MEYVNFDNTPAPEHPTEEAIPAHFVREAHASKNRVRVRLLEHIHAAIAESEHGKTVRGKDASRSGEFEAIGA